MYRKIKNLIIALIPFTFSTVSAQTEYSISVPEKTSSIVSGHLNLGGTNPEGVPIEFNSFYMSVGNKPFIPVMGEIHYARVPEEYWEEQILKMKSGGINVIASYIFWNIHEEEEGVFDWSGNKNLRKFLLLCQKHDMYTLARIGPFCHGEIRNGGIPDWLYGRPFEIRSNNDGYLFYVRRLYQNIAEQLNGLYYKDGGSIIGIQLENELQHSAAPWAFSFPEQRREMTVANYDAEITRIGVSVQDAKTAYANLGSQHLDTLKKIAVDMGMITPLYTVTGWGMAAILENEAIPVTAAYPYPFWAKPSMSPFFLFKDIQQNPDYSPVRYDGKMYPSFCAEMGVGIQITYTRRPRVDTKAAEALMLRTLGSGANGIGYYMYHGGLTPNRKGGGFFSDEPMGVPKISYDFQAPIGEYGKVRDSYFGLRIIHLFVENFADILAPMGVVLPETNADITPDNKETLRYSVRSDGKSGFVFMNNFQDHDTRHDQKVNSLNISLTNETISFPPFTLNKDVSLILPFNMQLNGGLLKYATVQPLAITETNGKQHYFFYTHDGLSPEYIFDKSSLKKVSGKKYEKDGLVHIKPVPGLYSTFTLTSKSGEDIYITTLTRAQALGFNQWEDGYCITNATLIKDKSEFQLQSRSNKFSVILPDNVKPSWGNYKAISKKQGLFTEHTIELPEANIEFDVKEISRQRYTFDMDKSAFSENLSDIILDISYVGDTGAAFIDGRMVNDHLYYGNNWQIGLKQYAEELSAKGMYFYFRPMQKDASYLIDFDEKNIPVFENNSICNVNSISVVPEYKITFKTNR